jgi:hypothetical protein
MHELATHTPHKRANVPKEKNKIMVKTLYQLKRINNDKQAKSRKLSLLGSV